MEPSSNNASSDLPSQRRRSGRSRRSGWRTSRGVRIKAPSVPREPWKKPQWFIHWRRTLLIVLGVIGVLAALWFGYRQLRKVQARRLTEMAISYLKEGKMQEAWMSLQTALRLAPFDPAALRLESRLTQEQGNGLQSLAAYERLAQSGKMSLGDLRPFASTAERQGDRALADRLAAAAAKNNPLLGHLIRADLLILRKQPDAALDELRTAIKESTKENAKEKNNADDQARMDLVKILSFHRPDDSAEQVQKNQMEALLLLREMGSRTNEIGAASLATAIRSGIVPTAELPDWIKHLRDHPKVTPELLLLADAAIIRADPTQKNGVVGAMISRVQSAPSEQRLAVARLLMELKDPASAAQLITRDEALKSTPAFALWMQAMCLTGRDEEVLKALSLPGNPLPAPVRDLERSALLRKLHQDDAAKEAYEKAYNDHVLHGANDQERLESVVILSASGEQGLADQGVKFLLGDPSSAEGRLRALTEGMRHTHDASRLLRVLELASAFPSLADSIALQNDLDYQRLLLDMPVDMEHLKARVSGNPNEFAFRVTESLALLKAGKNAESLAVLENIEAEVDAAKLPPSQMAVLAASMAANGDQKKASALLSRCPADLLMVQEFALIKGAFSSSAAPLPGPSISQRAGASPAPNSRAGKPSSAKPGTSPR